MTDMEKKVMIRLCAKIVNLTGEYKKIEPDCREGVRAQLERMKELCKERYNQINKLRLDEKGEQKCRLYLH